MSPRTFKKNEMKISLRFFFTIITFFRVFMIKFIVKFWFYFQSFHHWHYAFSEWAILDLMERTIMNQKRGLTNKCTAKRSIPSRHEILWRKLPKLFRNIHVVKLSSKLWNSSIRSNLENKARNSAACFDQMRWI